SWPSASAWCGWAAAGRPSNEWRREWGHERAYPPFGQRSPAHCDRRDADRAAVAVPLALADEFQVQRPDPAVSAAFDLHADPAELRLALAGRIPGLLRQQPDERLVLDRAGAHSRRARGLCPVAMGRAGQARA